MSNIYDMADTWNDAGTVFTAIKMGVTDTASDAGSLLMDLQVGGSSKFSVNKGGAVFASGLGNRGNPVFSFANDQNTGIYQTSADCISFSMGGQAELHLANGRVHIADDVQLEFGSYANTMGLVTTALVKEGTGVSGILAQRNGANAQTFNIYSSYTDDSNYTRGALKASSGLINLAGESAGTGDANIDIQLTPKGTGAVRFGAHAAIVAETVTGYIEIKDAGGTTRKLAVVS